MSPRHKAELMICTGVGMSVIAERWLRDETSRGISGYDVDSRPKITA